MNREKLQELRAEHGPSMCIKWRGPAFAKCDVWPCEQSVILDMALEAERLRVENRALLTDDVQYAQTSRGQLLNRVGELEREAARLREQVEMLGYLWTRDASYDDAAAFGELFAPIRSRTPVYSDQRRIAAVRSALAGTEATAEHRVDTDGDDRYCEVCHKEWPCPTINAWWDAPAGTEAKVD